MRASKYIIGIASVLTTCLLTGWAIQKFQKPGHLDVITAQAMDMSAMRPPVGPTPVDIATVHEGSISSVVTYTGTVAAYNEQIVSPRIVGTIVSLPVYPGDEVSSGQLLAQLDTAEVGAKAAEAADNAAESEQTSNIALLTHHLHHQAALDQASATRLAAIDAVSEAKAEESGDEAAVTDAIAGVSSAVASEGYWKTELPREKKLEDAGAVSEQEYENELSQAEAASAAVDQAKAKVNVAQQSEKATQAKVVEATRNADAADAGARMAVADLTVAEAQISQTAAAAESAKESEREAEIVEGYARITAPVAGVVTERPIAPGTLVQPGQEMLKIEEIDLVRVQANVAVADLTGLSVGSPVQIVTQGLHGDRTIESTISAIFPAANEETRTAVVESIVSNPHHALLPGAFVTMKLNQEGQASGLVAPSSAIKSQGGVSSVWVVNGGLANPAGPVTYACSVCHMRYTARQAAKLHYRDPMDGGYLLPLSAGTSASAGPMTVRQIGVTVLASDGQSTEVSADGVEPGSKVVAHGFENLVDGASVTQVPWGASGPLSLPNSAQASSGLKLYRCEKCGMTYSAADAKKNHYIDPMDGGKLVPVTGSNGTS